MKKNSEDMKNKEKSENKAGRIFTLILLPLIFLWKLISSLFKKFKLSISLKITATYLGLFLFSLLLVVILSLGGYIGFKINSLHETGNSYGKLIINKAVIEGKEIKEFLIDDRISDIYLYDENMNNILTGQPEEIKDRYEDNFFKKAESVLQSKIYRYSEIIIIEGTKYYINIDFDVAATYDEIKLIGFFISGAGFFGVILLLAIGPSASRKIVKPIKDMTEVARTISANNINTRLDIKSSQHELRELAETFNSMMDRIQDEYSRQQQFVSDASHELRTPIAVLKGYADMLGRWGKDDKDVLDESIAAIKNEADNMQDLVDKLLFLARNDKNTLKLVKDEFIINEIIEEVVKETAMIDGNHQIKSSLCPDVIVYGDRNRIKQALRIFVENARKFTPDKGVIKIHCSTEDEYVKISVEDSGIGIKNKDLKNIFNRFYTAEESRDKQQGGHGLGLSIAKIIILGHRGKINVRSKFGEGSVFTLMLLYIKSASLKRKNSETKEN